MSNPERQFSGKIATLARIGSPSVVERAGSCCLESASVWRKELPDGKGRKTGFVSQCYQFNAKLAHFIRRLGTVPAGTDFCEFSGKKRTQSGDQNETRNDADHV